MKFRVILTALAVAVSTAFLSGCQHNIAKLQKYDGTLDEKSAVVIAKVDNADYIFIKQYDPEDPDFADVEYRIVQPMKSLMPYNYTKSIYNVEPGTYYISYAFEYDSKTGALKQTNEPGITDEDQVTYAAFTVKPGDVLYVGDVHVNWVTNDLDKRFAIAGDVDQVKKDLNLNGRRDIADKLQVANLHDAGSKSW